MGNLTDHFSSGTSTNVLEHLIWQPDGRIIKTVNGDKTAETVTARFVPPNSWTNSGGSSIDYTPPEGTKNLLYRFNFNYDYYNGYIIWLTAIHIDGTQVVTSRDSLWGGTDDYRNAVSVCRALQVGAASEDIANGKIGTWTSDKTLQYRIASYNSSYDYYAFSNGYTIGANDGSYQPPTFELIATT